jgi:hypothetical protein
MNENESTDYDVLDIDCIHSVDDNVIIGIYTNTLCALQEERLSRETRKWKNE